MDKLDNCPFCGGSAVMEKHEAHEHSRDGLAGFMPPYPGSFTIECANDDCNCGMIAMEPNAEDKVVAAWNRRAAPAQGDGKPVAINAQFDTGLNRRKLTDLAQRGHEITGHILHKDGKYALFDGSCRWLTQPQYQRLMHEQNDSLFAPAQQAVDLSDVQIEEIWESLPGLKIISGRPQDQWNRLLRHEYARALLAAQKGESKE